MSDEEPDPTPQQPRQPVPPQRPNAFDRIFPGPAPQDPRLAARLEQIQRAAERRMQRASQHGARQQPDRSTRSEDRTDPTAQQGRLQPGQLVQPAPELATTDDVSQLRDALHEQTDVIRALLDANVAIRDDARSTAQNSRTFAIAGVVIAFFTLAATVVTIVVAALGA